MNATKYTVLLLFFSLAFPLPAVAEGGREEQRIKRQASRYFSRGEILFDAGNYSKAAEAFSLAYETYPHPSTLVNIGLCYERAGWLPKAAETYEKYLSLAAGAPDEKDIRQKLKKIHKSVGEIVITCLSNDDECAIRVDGIDRGNAPLTVLVEPGQRSVEAFIRGTKAYASTIAIDAGESRVVEIMPSKPALASPSTDSEQAEPQPPPKKAEPESPTNDTDEKVDGQKKRVSMSTAFWVAAGVTVAAGATTIVFGVRLYNDKKDFEASDKTDLDASEDGKKNQIATNVLIGVTSAAAVVAISLAIRDIWFSDDHKDASKTKVTLGPGLGVGLTRSF